MKCITHTVTRPLQENYYITRKVSTFKEVQLLQTQHHGANCIKVRHTERKFNIRTYHTFTGRPLRLLYATDAISANVARELHNYSNRESVTAWMCTSGRCSSVCFVLAYTSGILDFSILTAFHTLSLLHFPLPHFQRPINGLAWIRRRLHYNLSSVILRTLYNVHAYNLCITQFDNGTLAFDVTFGTAKRDPIPSLLAVPNVYQLHIRIIR